MTPATQSKEPTLDIQFEQLLEFAPDAVVGVDQRGRVQLVNTQVEEIFGYERDELIGETIEKLVPRRFHSAHVEHRTGYFEDPRTRPMGAGLELYAMRKDGSEFPCEISLSALETAQGRLGLAAVRDVSERKRAEEKIRHTAEELVRSNADLEQFAYVASHDLSEPLRTVSGFVQLLAERTRGKVDSDADEFAEYAIAGVQRMQELLDGLLAYSRVGTMAPDSGPVDCAQVLARVRAALGSSIESAGAELVTGELPTVDGDRTQLEQLFQNLIANALKFRASERLPRIEVCAERSGDAWLFHVTDNGIGIEPRYRERIFKMFQRLHGRDEYDGIGAGLAICKKIVERHGGQIWVEPGPDETGTAFRFTLPDRGGPK